MANGNEQRRSEGEISDLKYATKDDLNKANTDINLLKRDMSNRYTKAQILLAAFGVAGAMITPGVLLAANVGNAMFQLVELAKPCG